MIHASTRPRGAGALREQLSCPAIRPAGMGFRDWLRPDLRLALGLALTPGPCGRSVLALTALLCWRRDARSRNRTKYASWLLQPQDRRRLRPKPSSVI